MNFFINQNIKELSPVLMAKISKLLHYKLLGIGTLDGTDLSSITAETIITTYYLERNQSTKLRNYLMCPHTDHLSHDGFHWISLLLIRNLCEICRFELQKIYIQSKITTKPNITSVTKWCVPPTYHGWLFSFQMFETQYLLAFEKFDK